MILAIDCCARIGMTELETTRLAYPYCIFFITDITDLPVPDQVNLSFVKIKLENLISINLASDYLVNPDTLAAPCPPLR